jgi:hypothetical protein
VLSDARRPIQASNAGLVGTLTTIWPGMEPLGVGSVVQLQNVTHTLRETFYLNIAFWFAMMWLWQNELLPKTTSFQNYIMQILLKPHFANPVKTTSCKSFQNFILQILSKLHFANPSQTTSCNAFSNYILQIFSKTTCLF